MTKCWDNPTRVVSGARQTPPDDYIATELYWEEIPAKKAGERTLQLMERKTNVSERARAHAELIKAELIKALLEE